ncbi:hypothetical protein QBC44DRAFT_401743, partial [Cladorrhinum sp. PSN332]
LQFPLISFRLSNQLDTRYPHKFLSKNKKPPKPIKMQSKILLLTATMAATVLANPGANIQARQDTSPSGSDTPSATDPIVIGGAGPGETEITIFPSATETPSASESESHSHSSGGTTLSTSTSGAAPSQSLACPALITAFESKIPQPTGAVSSFYNSILTAADVCALVRAPPSSLASQVNAYQTSLESFFAAPSNVESLVGYAECVALEPTATLNSAEAKFWARATSVTKCKSAAAGGLKMGMGGVSVVVGLVAGLVAFGMA